MKVLFQLAQTRYFYTTEQVKHFPDSDYKKLMEMCGNFKYIHQDFFYTQMKSIKKAFQEQVEIFEINQINTKDLVNKK